jgi:hypothetical protein
MNDDPVMAAGLVERHFMTTASSDLQEQVDDDD